MARSTVAVKFTGDTANLKRALGDVDGKIGKIGGTFSGFGKAAALGLAGAAAGAVAMGKSFVDAAVESQKVTKQTEAVLKSMGLEAGVSAKNIGDLAEQMAMKSGVDDEVIQSGMNVLLTFGNVADSAQEVGGIFDQASQAALDMSVALGTDVTSASMMVGKALNDPIKGLAKLSRSGVQFSKEQEDQIKTMVLYGKTGEAQAIMLEELNKQFGGSAAAQATAGDRLKVVWGNLQEELGARLLPIVEKVAAFLSDNLPKAMDVLGRTLGPVIAGLQQFWGIFARRDFTGGPLAEDSPLIDGAFKIRDAITKAIPTVQKFAQTLKANLKPILIGLGAALAVLISPIGAVVAALVLAYKRFEGFRNVVDSVVQFLRGTVAPAIALFATYVADQFGNLTEWVREHWDGISEAIGHVIVAVQTTINAFVATVSAAWRMWGDNIMTVVQTVFGVVRQVVESAVAIVAGIIETAVNLINGEWGAAWDSFKGIFAAAWDAVVAYLEGGVKVITSLVSGIGEAVGRVAGRMFDGVKSAFKSAINWIIRAWNRMEFKIPGFDPPGPGPKFGGFTLGVPDIPELATGGIVRATRGGTVVRVGEGRYDEAVVPLDGRRFGGPQVIQLVVDGRVLAEAVHNADARNARNLGNR